MESTKYIVRFIIIFACFTVCGQNFTYGSLLSAPDKAHFQEVDPQEIELSVERRDCDAEPIVVTTTATHATSSSSNGFVTASATGGVEPYRYNVNNGPLTTNNIFSNLSPGTYSFDVFDANGCTLGTTITIPPPTPILGLSVSLSSNDSQCGSSNGSVTATVQGGTAPYTYSIDGGLTTVSNNVFSNLAADSYTVLVADANGYTTTESVVINESAQLVASLSSSDALCHGSSDGSITASVQGGTAPYTYSIDGGVTSVSNNVFGSLIAGSYTVLITDTNGCTVTESVVINEPAQLVVPLSASDALCHGNSDGSITASVQGGTAPYTYSIDGGLTSVSNNVFGSLIAGSYTVLVTDANGCTATESVVIKEPAQLVTSLSVNDVLCHGGADGSLTTTIQGGTAPYAYSINGGVTTNLTGIFGGLTAGNYVVEVTDANGCATTESIVINEPAQLVATVSSSDVQCYRGSDGSLTAMVQGGTSPYMYSIDGSTPTANSIFNDLSAGGYAITVTDAKGCTVVMNTHVREPSAPVILTTTITPISCNGEQDGSISFTVQGGTAGYTYFLDGVMLANSNTITGLSVGDYLLKVVDARGCEAFERVRIIEPSPLVISGIDITPTSCVSSSNGEILVAGLGGTPPYQYKVSGGTYSANPILGGLGVGQYTVFVMDASGCEYSEDVDVGLQPSIVESFSYDYSYDCEQKRYTLLLFIEGDYDYEYRIDGVNSFQSNLEMTGLQAGVYVVTVREVGTSCFASYTVVLPEAFDPSKVVLVESNSLCVGKESDVMIEGLLPESSYSLTFAIDGEESRARITSDAEGVAQLSFSTDKYNIEFYLKSLEPEFENSCPIYPLDKRYDLSLINCELFIYDAFTPNGDGKNDFLTIRNIEKYPNSVLQVYNRHGAKVYEIGGYNNDWRGIPNQLIGNANVRRGHSNRISYGAYFCVILIDGKPVMQKTVYLIRKP